MNWLCGLFGHSWKCFMGCNSYCRFCGKVFDKDDQDKMRRKHPDWFVGEPSNKTGAKK